MGRRDAEEGPGVGAPCRVTLAGSDPTQLRLRIEPRWVHDVCVWTGRPVGDPGPAAWALLLVPGRVDERFAKVSANLEVFHRLRWRAPFSGTDVTVTARPLWVSTRGQSAETGFETAATVGGVPVAESLIVTRAKGHAPSWGRRAVPAPPPPLSEPKTTRSLAIDEREVRTLAELAHAEYPLHTNASFAQGHGYATVILQGLLLMVRELQSQAAGEHGMIEFWFHAPIPAGSIVKASAASTSPGGVEYWLVGASKLAATGRVRLRAQGRDDASRRAAAVDHGARAAFVHERKHV
jgi:acyl dehydratase